MKAWTAYTADAAEDGAMLVFAENWREAKKVAFPLCQSLLGTEWVDLRVYLLSNQSQYLKHNDGRPAATDYIPGEFVCDVCELWGKPMVKPEPDFGLCCEDCWMLEDVQDATEEG